MPIIAGQYQTAKTGHLLFAKLKALLRKAAARTLDTLIAAIKAALDAVPQQECADYIANAGYPT